ncbi:MAG: hypothetical protein ABSD38_29025 [Syntrophorhabdales bacterium]
MERVVRDTVKKNAKKPKGKEVAYLREKSVFEQIVNKVLEAYSLCAKGEEEKEEEDEESRQFLFLMLRLWMDAYIDGTMLVLGRVMVAASDLIDDNKSLNDGVG